MNAIARKKSPRAPSISLGDAIEKACKIYDKERCHVAPVDGVAQHIGYKNAGNGAALGTIASLKYFGLLDRPKEGMVAVSKDVEAYRFAPSEATKQALITKWLKSPPLFAELLEKYTEGLPSDATLKFELIQKGFAPAAADLCLQVFRRSVDFAHFFERAPYSSATLQAEDDLETGVSDLEQMAAPVVLTGVAGGATQPTTKGDSRDDVDRIPVRLAGGRRAWIEIPMPFFEADKERLKKQIDLLLTNDEESGNDLL